MRGLDYSAARIPGQVIKAAGYDYVIRYVDTPAPGRPLKSKHVRPDEYAELRKAGVQVWLVFEVGVNDMLAGRAAGEVNARRARAGADLVGYPADGLIFMACDRHLTDPDPAVTARQMAAALAYVDGAISVLGSACGVYGFSELINACARSGRGAGYWLAGSRPATSSPAHVWQRNDGATIVGGVACDINETLRPLPDPGGVDWVEPAGLPELREGDGYPPAAPNPETAPSPEPSGPEPAPNPEAPPSAPAAPTETSSAGAVSFWGQLVAWLARLFGGAR